MKALIAPLVPPYSLSRRLFGFLLVPLLVLLGISIITDYREGLHVANKAYDHALFNTALAVSARLDRDAPGLGFELPQQADAVLRTDLADKVFYAVIDPHGKLIYGDKLLLPFAVRGDGEKPLYRFSTLNGHTVRVLTYRYRPSQSARQGASIVVAETTHKREDAASHIMVTTLWGDVLLIATSLGVVFFGIRYALSPLNRISQQIELRAPGDLSPVSEEGAPLEIRALVSAINRLMRNLREAAVAQQAFISSAAHQLRTPLAALQTQLELASETTEGETQLRLQRIQASATRLARLTKQMLSLARSSRDANQISDPYPVALEDLLEVAASEFIDVALEKNIDLGFEHEGVSVMGAAWALREMLANLIDNALRYTDEGGRVTVRCGTQIDGKPFLEVEDSGPGIPVADRDKVFDRFERLGEQSAEGSGLGLAIVKEVAALHHAKIALGSAGDGHGLLVKVTFPIPSAFPAHKSAGLSSLSSGN